MSSRVWTGIILMLIGVGFLLHQLDIWNFTYILRTWWPLILIVIGVNQLIRHRNSSPVISFIIIFVGVAFLLNQWIDVNLMTFIWPLILILIGLTIIFTRNKEKKILDSNHSIESFSLFSGTNLRSESHKFQGGNIMTIFGGSEVDLREVTVSKDGASLELTVIFGGIEVIMPDNVRIEVRGLPVFGGWEDSTRRTSKEADAPLIKINCLSIFGGIEIKD